MEPQDTITIAPSVLMTIARHAATQVGGVSRTGTIPVNVVHLLKGNPMASGVILEVDGIRVKLDLYLLVNSGANIREVGEEVQRAVTRAIEDLVGMQVTGVNIHFEDVDSLPGGQPVA
jgi:uncharacterized alkaline shock family protein YloU